MGVGEHEAVGGDVIRPSAPPPCDGPSAILGRALDILTGVRSLLEALSPADVEAMAARVHLGVERLDDRHAIFWRVYAARYRVLVDVFATQHAELAERARVHAELRPDAAEEGSGR
jgi:hypothetical protein